MDARMEPGHDDRARAALRALARFRERRARDGAGVRCLLDRHRQEVAEGPHRRRAEMLRRATAELGLPRDLAEDVYDIAREEGLEPELAFELAYCGVAVCGPDEGGEPAAPTTMRGGPDWLAPGIPADAARRERRLRTSFRRLRSLLEQAPTPEDALVAFATEPDVDECGY